MMKIRDYLKIGLVGLVLSGCQKVSHVNSYMNYKHLINQESVSLERTIGEKTLLDFPKEIPGAESVETYLAPTSNYCLVHIRQTHLTENNSKGELEKIKKVQDNIYQILSFLIENYNIKKVYEEGIIIGSHVKNSCAEINYLKKDLNNIKKEDPNLFESYQYFEKWKEYDAVYRIASDTGLGIAGAENPENLDKAQDTYDRLKGLEFFRWLTEKEKIYMAVHENREDFFLELASKENNPLVVVVFGANHAWGGRYSCGEEYGRRRESFKDNLAFWGMNNQKKIFSLVEITPFGIIH